VSLTRAIAVAGLCCIMIGGCASGGPYEPATYVVRPEDTLYSIAWRHNLDYRAIAKWNNIGTDYRVSIGQVLVLQPSGESRAPRASQPATSAGARETRTGNVPSVGKPVPLADPPAGVGLPNGSQRAFGPATKESALVPAPMPAPAPVPVPTPAPVPSPCPLRAARSLLRHRHRRAPIRSGFGPPTDCRRRGRCRAAGFYCLGAGLGQDVRAAGSGRVVYTGSGLRGYGNLIIIKHGDSLLSSYAHNRELLVHEGQDVAAGQVIAHMGMGPHQISALYFEIRVNGKPTDPLRYLRAAP